MKSNKIKKILDKILVSFIPVILVVILLNPIPRIISNNTGKDYVSFLGMVYHKHWNDNSPTNHFHMVRIKNADSKTFVVDGKGYSHDKNRFFWGEMQISKAEFDAAMEDLKS